MKLIIFLSTWLVGFPLWAESKLSLNSYLDSVISNNTSYKAAAYLAKALELRVGEASLDFMPKFTGNFSYSDNRLLQSSPFASPTTISWAGSLGLQTKLRTGTSVSLSYANNYINAAPSPVISGYTFFVDGPTVSITQPLWQDFWGSASKAGEEAQLATLSAQSLQQQYTKQQIIFNAEVTYWRLALFREIVTFDKQALDRTEKILNWNKKRVAMNVADRVDLLQAQAAYKQKQLQLQSDLEQLRMVATQFNSLRNITGDQVSENLPHVDVALNSKMISEIKKTADRLDIQAQIQNAYAQKAQADANREKVKPSIQLTGTLQLSGRDTASMTTAMNGSFSTNNPLYGVGLTMSIPIDFGTVSDINEGNRAAAMAAQYTAERAKFDLDQEWNDLKKKFKDVLVRFEMAKELELLQKEKLDHEKRRFNSGRTTSFQVLQFEDHYSEAQLNRLRIENDAITLQAQVRLFNGGSL